MVAFPLSSVTLFLVLAAIFNDARSSSMSAKMIAVKNAADEQSRFAWRKRRGAETNADTAVSSPTVSIDNIDVVAYNGDLDMSVEFTLPASVREVMDTLWTDVSFYETFLRDVMDGRDLEVSGWRADMRNPFKKRRTLTLNSSHKVKIPLLGSLFKAQSLRNLVMEEGPDSFVVRQAGRTAGMPYADHFQLLNEWRVAKKGNSFGWDKEETVVRVYSKIVFTKDSVAKPYVEASIKSQLQTLCDKWAVAAQDRFSEKTALV